VHSAFIDGELDLAKAIAEKNKMALRNPCDLLTMAHAGTIFHVLSGFGTSIDLRNTQRALAIERFAERFAAAEHGPPEERPSSLALMPRRGAAAGRDQSGLVNQVAGADSAVESYHDEHARFGGPGSAETDYAGRSGFDSASLPGDSAWGYFPPHDALAAQSRGISSCWNPNCSRMHNGTYWYALCSTCWTFEPNSRRCKKSTAISSPSAPKCPNWSRTGLHGHARRFRRAHI